MSRRSSRRPASFAGALLLLVVVGCRQLSRQTPTRPPSGGSSRPSNGTRPSGGSTAGSSNEGNLLLGNASGAATDANNFLLEKPQYTLSYNHRNGGPNWVAWHTDESNLGDAKRKDRFHPDPDLPRDWQILPTDYKNSGYDRGHVCPSGDRTNSPEDNDTTFCMSNMMPQTPELNRNVWASLEDYLRDQVKAGNEVYEVAGPAGNAGTIAGGAVVVPKYCWKVALVMPVGTSDANRITAQTRVISVAMPNVADKRLETADWRSYVTTPRKIEDATHLDLFSGLSPQVKRALEQKTDSGS